MEANKEMPIGVAMLLGNKPVTSYSSFESVQQFKSWGGDRFQTKQ